MGGSMLGQVLNQPGDAVPDLDDPQDLMQPGQRRQRLRAQGQILAYHDRSDGGLLAVPPKWPLPAMWAWR
jgi:phosphoribosylformylglycinamidine synthase